MECRETMQLLPDLSETPQRFMVLSCLVRELLSQFTDAQKRDDGTYYAAILIQPYAMHGHASGCELRVPDEPLSAHAAL